MLNKVLYLVLLIIVPLTVYVYTSDWQTKIRMFQLERQESTLMQQDQYNKNKVEQSIINLTKSATELADAITNANLIDAKLKSVQEDIEVLQRADNLKHKILSE